LFNTVGVEDSNGGVVSAEIFVRPNCDIFVVLVASIIVGAAGEGVSSIGSAQLVFEEDVVLLSLQ
jgi:hypothetical protein